MEETNETIYMLLLIISVVGVFFNVMAMPNIINILTRVYSIPFQKSSTFLSAYQIAYGTGALFASFFHFKFSKKKTMLLSLGGYSVYSLLIVFIDNFDLLILLRIIGGGLASLIMPSVIAVINDLKNNKGKRVGLIFTLITISGLVGVITSGVLDWKLLFLIPSVFSAAAFILVSHFFKENTAVSGHRQDSSIVHVFRLYKKLIFSRERFFVFLMIFLNSFFLTGIYSCLAYYFSSAYLIKKDIISLLLTGLSFGGIFGNFTGGLLIDQNKLRIIYFSSILSIILSTFLLFFKFPLAFNFLFLILLALGRTFFHNLWLNQFMKFPEEFNSSSTSFNSFTVFFASSVSLTIVAFLIKYMEFKWYLLIVTFIYFIFLFFSERILKKLKT